MLLWELCVCKFMEQTKALILMGSLGVFIVSVLFLIYFGGSIFSSGDSDLFSEKQVSSDADGTLTFWGVFDTSDDYLEAIEEFGKRYPEKVVEYTRFRNEVDYKRALLDAFAGGRGPDIFMIRNTDVAQYTDKAIPVASYILSISSLNNLFPDVVVDNFVRDGGVYALPLTIDTLALLYNKNHFNEATIVFPPITWEEIKGIVFDLVRYDNEGNIVGRRIALGGGNDTISNGTHILELMALQFNSMSGGEFRISSSDSSYALSFYSQFARPGGD
jgi:ABC-type glycerol-3-phosphate transport system substrate-binding protein